MRGLAKRGARTREHHKEKKTVGGRVETRKEVCPRSLLRKARGWGDAVRNGNKKDQVVS